MIYVFLLLLVTAVWGWTFVLVKDAITQYPTLPFLQLRFILAFLVMAVLVHRLPARRELRLGVIVGAVLAAGYLTQTVGLTMTSPGNSGLITGLFVVFTPLIDRFFGVKLRWWTLVAVVAALAGTVLLVGGPSGVGLGDILTIACAFLFGLHIVLLSHWSPGLRSAPLAMVQMGSCALIFSAGGSWSLRVPSQDVWIAIVITGVFASALAFYIQTWAQQHLSASRTALILTTEPAWAVAAAVILAGQRFGSLQAAGAALVLAAIVGHELAHLKFKAHGDEAKT
ncbi:MAG TPA: DMT family transporter [Candidatus Polarisedimenticolia bacterium]|nr:DMT family transporter [Candidatus Polarisedimenticolia bacterium]